MAGDALRQPAGHIWLCDGVQLVRGAKRVGRPDKLNIQNCANRCKLYDTHLPTWSPEQRQAITEVVGEDDGEARRRCLSGRAHHR